MNDLAQARTIGVRDEGETPPERLARRVAELVGLEPELREVTPLPAVTEAIVRPGIGLRRIVATVMEAYADRPAIGQRDYELAPDPRTGRRVMRSLPSYSTISYAELWRRVRRLSGRWGDFGGAPDTSFVVILGHPSADHVTVDLACTEANAVSIPLQTSVTAEQLAAIVGDTRPYCIAAAPDFLDKAIDALGETGVEAMLLVFGYEPQDDNHRAQIEAAAERGERGDARFDLVMLDDVCRSGPVPDALGTTDVDGDAERPAAIFYTSGSTGSPKGAVYPERLLRGLWRPRSGVPTIVFHYQPLSHVSGRSHLMGALSSGGTCFFVRADLAALDEDLALVRPTVMGIVPRVTEMIFGAYQAETARRRAAGAPADVARQEVMADLRHRYLGGRLLQASVGTAPCSIEVKTFLNECFDIDVVDIYGATEAAPITLNGVVQRPPIQSYKLIDVPELGYFTSDRPHPRGELLVKTANLFLGYFNNPAASAQVFDEDGFYKTGDIMEERGPDRLAYLDRRNNVLKLSQGEFVAVAPLETLFVNGSPLIEQIYLYGNSERAFLLAVIVPVAELIAEAKEGEAGWRRCRARLAEAIGEIARDHHLNGYEAPRDFIIEFEPFSIANGLLTDTRKPRRRELKTRYGERLEALYRELAERQASELASLREGAGGRPVLETLARAMTVSLGIQRTEGFAASSFGDLGGDSLAAVSFSLLVEELFGVPLPVGSLLGATTTFGDIAAQIEAALAGGGRARPGFGDIHGKGAKEARSADLSLDKLLDPIVMAKIPTLDGVVDEAPQTVLLTGANGYLGRFLCLEWLEWLAREGRGKLICVVRAPDDHAARRRVVEAFGVADAELVRRFDELADGRLEVIAGDIAQPRLGLDAETWDRLAREVDLIAHPAALVNHILPYEQLFEPNVLGVAELIALALSARRKRIAFISSVAVCGGGRDIDEDQDVRAASAVRPIDDRYGNGYANSKWAGEVLLREAHEKFGLPVDVFRSDMILAHSTYRGQINVNDVFSRLLFSLTATGIAPPSFYAAPAAGAPARPHYDGLPADFTARAIVAIAAETGSKGFATYHVVNPHDDAISLDTFVDWMRQAGHDIRRLDDYEAWLTRFRTALQALPDDVRPLSSLAVLGHLRAPTAAHPGSVFSATRFAAKVEALGLDGGIPRLSSAFVRKCLDDLSINGMALPR